jgi:predicted CXXCH cytochrome family protein
MDLALAIAALLLAALATTARRSRRTMQLALVGATAVAIPLAMAKQRQVADASSDVGAELRPQDTSAEAKGGFVSSKACASCHPSAYETWRKTHHAKMTQLPTRANIQAPWKNGTTLEHEGRSYQLLRKGDGFWVEMPHYGGNGEQPFERHRRPVVMVTGSHHQQLFWIPVPWADRPNSPEGRSAYMEYCSSCHGANGYGNTARALREEELYRDEIQEAIDDDVHAKVTARPAGRARRFVVDYVEQLQLRDRLQQFPFSWLIGDQRWVHEDDTFLDRPSEANEFERFEEGWSDSCDQCHSLGPRFVAHAEGGLGEASVAELGISCENCHGPGAAHVAFHKNPISRYRARLSKQPVGNIVLPTRLDKQRESGLCGNCHADTLVKEKPKHERPFRPGDRLEDFVHVLQWHDPPYPPWLKKALSEDKAVLSSAFWNDGTMRIAGRDYNALLESPCHTQGDMRCSSCHQMHGSHNDDQLKPGARSAKPCVQCHESIAANISAHSHHPADSSGSNCLNCHMPYTTYGLLKAIRSHRVDSPTAKMSAEKGRPNACNLCHLDKSLASVADTLSSWYGQPRLPDKDREALPASVAWLIRGDGVQRAIAAWHFGWQPAQQASGRWWLAPFLARVLDDQYAAVRYLAGHSLQRLPGFADFRYDYVGSGRDRARARRQATARWKRQAAKRDFLAAGIRAGNIDAAHLNALASERDDTPVHVNE